MAKSTVPVNFKDDIMNSSMGGKRRYKMINNSDGTISLEDATKYDQVGSNFGAAQLNATNQAVNAAADAGKIIDDIDAIRNVTKEGYMAGALALKQVDDSLGVISGKAVTNDASWFTVSINCLKSNNVVFISGTITVLNDLNSNSVACVFPADMCKTNQEWINIPAISTHGSKVYKARLINNKLVLCGENIPIQAAESVLISTCYIL